MPCWNGIATVTPATSGYQGTGFGVKYSRVYRLLATPDLPMPHGAQGNHWNIEWAEDQEREKNRLQSQTC